MSTFVLSNLIQHMYSVHTFPLSSIFLYLRTECTFLHRNVKLASVFVSRITLKKISCEDSLRELCGGVSDMEEDCLN